MRTPSPTQFSLHHMCLEVDASIYESFRADGRADGTVSNVSYENSPSHDLFTAMGLVPPKRILHSS